MAANIIQPRHSLARAVAINQVISSNGAISSSSSSSVGIDYVYGYSKHQYKVFDLLKDGSAVLVLRNEADRLKWSVRADDATDIPELWDCMFDAIFRSHYEEPSTAADAHLVDAVSLPKNPKPTAVPGADDWLVFYEGEARPLAAGIPQILITRFKHLLALRDRMQEMQAATHDVMLFPQNPLLVHVDRQRFYTRALLRWPCYYYQHCNRQQLHQQLRSVIAVLGDGLEVRPSRITNAGLGLFATRPFARYAIITQYTGQLVSAAEINKLDVAETSHMHTVVSMQWAIDGRMNPNFDKAMLPMGDAKSLNALKIGGGQFSNDALDSGFDNNASFCTVASWESALLPLTNINAPIDPRDMVDLLVAVRPIDKDEEIFVDYGKDYWKRLMKK